MGSPGTGRGRLPVYLGIPMTYPYFKRWFFWATHCRLEPVIAVARMMKKHLVRILNYLCSRLTNAITESLNAKIQEVKYRARGYRNRENFRLAILFRCGGLDMNPR